MRTFIFIRNKKRGNRIKRVIVGMIQSDMFPSDKIHNMYSEFYGCDCVEIAEHCDVEISDWF